MGKLIKEKVEKYIKKTILNLKNVCQTDFRISLDGH